jgi:hypothetical protein
VCITVNSQRSSRKVSDDCCNEVVKVISAIVLADLTDSDAHNQLDAFIGQNDTVLFKGWFQVYA